jgi:hypothetical protein
MKMLVVPSLVDQLSTRLPVPDDRALTRSQRLFAIATNIDPRSLSIKGGDEFFLFMEMRIKHRWVSFNMSSKKWVTATHLYNADLTIVKARNGTPAVPKNPRALLDKLGEVESSIVTRITTGNYKCTSSLVLSHLKPTCFE